MKTLEEVVAELKAQETPNELDMKNMKDIVDMIHGSEYMKGITEKLVLYGTAAMSAGDPLKALKLIVNASLIAGIDIARRMYSPSEMPK